MNSAWRMQQQRLFWSTQGSAFSRRTTFHEQHLLKKLRQTSQVRNIHQSSSRDRSLNPVYGRFYKRDGHTRRIRIGPSATICHAPFSTLGPFEDDEQDELVAISSDQLENPQQNSNPFWKRSFKKSDYINSLLNNDEGDDNGVKEQKQDDVENVQVDDSLGANSLLSDNPAADQDPIGTAASKELSSNVNNILDKMSGRNDATQNGTFSTHDKDNQLQNDNPFASSYPTANDGLFSSLGPFTDDSGSNKRSVEKNPADDSFSIFQHDTGCDQTINPFMENPTTNDYRGNERSGRESDNPFDAPSSFSDNGPFSFMDLEIERSGRGSDNPFYSPSSFSDSGPFSFMDPSNGVDFLDERRSSSMGSESSLTHSQEPIRPQHLRDFDMSQIEDTSTILQTEKEAAFQDIRRGISQQIEHILETLDNLNEGGAPVGKSIDDRFQLQKRFLGMEQDEELHLVSSDRALFASRALLRTLSDVDWKGYYTFQQSMAVRPSMNDELITHFAQREEEHSNIAAFLENRFGSEDLESIDATNTESKEAASFTEPLTTDEMNLLLAHMTLCMDPSEIQSLVFRHFIDPNGGLNTEQFDAITFELIFLGLFNKLRNRSMTAHVVMIHEMTKKPHLWTPSSIALLFGFYRGKLDVEGAMELFGLVKSLRAFHLSGSAYQQLLALLIQQDKIDHAKEVLQHMLENCNETQKDYVLQYVFRHWPFVKVSRVQEKSGDISFLREAFNAATSMSNEYAYTPSFHVLRQLIETAQPKNQHSKAGAPLKKVGKDENEDRLTLIRDVFHFLQYEHEYYKPSRRMVVAALQAAEYFSDSPLAVNVLQRLFPSDSFSGGESTFGDEGFSSWSPGDEGISSFGFQSDQPLFDFGFDSDHSSGSERNLVEDRQVFDFGLNSDEESSSEKKPIDEKPVFDFGSNAFETSQSQSMESKNNQIASDSYRGQESTIFPNTSTETNPFDQVDESPHPKMEVQSFDEASLIDKTDAFGEFSDFETLGNASFDSNDSSGPEFSEPLDGDLSFSNLSKVMDLCIKSGDVPSALTIFEKVTDLEDSFPFATQQMVFRSTLRTCASAGETEATEKFFLTMLTDGLNPSEHDFASAIHSFRNESSMDRVKEFVDRVSNKGLEPGVHCFNTLISLYTKKEQYDDSLDTYRLLKEKGMELHPSASIAVVLSSFKKGGLNSARLVLEEIAGSDNVEIKRELCFLALRLLLPKHKVHIRFDGEDTTLIDRVRSQLREKIQNESSKEAAEWLTNLIRYLRMADLEARREPSRALTEAKLLARQSNAWRQVLNTVLKS